jgi:hypothetical protein
MFYHNPREELIADGKVPWREFVWHYGQPGTVDRKLNHNGATMMMMTMTGIRNGPDPATLWAESPAGLMDVADPKIELWRVEAVAGMQEDHLVGEECHSMMCPHHHAEVVVLQMKKELLGNYGRPGVVS